MFRTFLILLAIALIPLGCTNEPVAGVAVAPAPAQQEQGEQEKGIADKVTGLVETFKSKTPSLDDMKKMMGETGQSAEKATSDVMEQVTSLYNEALKQGDTQRQNVTEFISDEWSGMNALEYKVVAGSENLEEQLNELGKQRWDCFHVSETAAGTKFFLKRQRKSYLRNIPFKDLLLLVPFLNNE